MNSKLQKALTAFHSKCITKFNQKETQGYTGWDEPSEAISDELLEERMKENIMSEDWVDVSNIAMILNYRQSQ